MDENELVDVRAADESVEAAGELDGTWLGGFEEVEATSLDETEPCGALMVAVEEAGTAEAPSCLGVTALTAR